MMHPAGPGPQRKGALSQSLDHLAVIIAGWPWWAIIIVVGLVIAIYSLFTSPLYHRALSFVSDSPQLTTNRIASVAYDVRQPDGKTAQVSGTLIGDEADSVTVITTDEVQVPVLRDDITNFTCKGGTPENCPLNSAVTFIRATDSGALTFEGLGDYRINTIFGQDDIHKVAVATVTVDGTLASLDAPLVTIKTPDGVSHVWNVSDVKPTTCDGAPVPDFPSCAANARVTLTRKLVERTPTGCSSDPNGGCSVAVTLDPANEENQISGTLIASAAGTLTAQTVPPVITTIKKSDILRTINYLPSQCAINNIGACRLGIFLTLWLTLAAFGLALILGLAFGLMRVSANPVLYNFATLYVEVMRGIPLLVILLFTGFVIEPWYHDNFNLVGPNLALIIGGIAAVIAVGFIIGRARFYRTDPAELLQPLSTTVILGSLLVVTVLFLSANRVNDPFLRAVMSGIVGLAIGYGAYLAELFRAGIESIGRGQMEAARSLGMTYVQAMRFVILPQAFRVILPPLGNDFIAMLKDTSLVAVLAVPELTQQGRIFASNTYRPFQTYITIGVLYLCMTLFLSLMVRVIERRISFQR